MLNQMAKKAGEAAGALLACVFLLLAPLVQAADSSSASFDHAKTGYMPRGIHTTLRCEQCHVDGIFKNTPKTCAGCHSLGSRVAATYKSSDHVPTALACDVCHTSPTSFQVKSFPHPGITDKCANCHNGRFPKVAAKHATHFPTALPCENCHTNLTTFSNWRMDHTGITSTCVTCHSGHFPGIAGKSATHISSNNACDSCHSGFTSFSGARYNHDANSVPVANICSNCHGGSPGITPKPVTHFPTTAQCDTCHTQSNTGNYLTFSGIRYAHSAVDNCLTCHNGGYTNASAKPSTHAPTTAQCSVCHTPSNTSNYQTFRGGSFAHSTPPGVCASCHNDTQASGKPVSHIPTTAACDSSGCHSQANTSNYTTFLGATYTHATPPGVCSTCHNGVTAPGKSATHVVTTGACSFCHTQTNTANYTTFLGAAYVHASPPGTCSTCHNGSQATGKPSFHIPTTAACNSSGCHSQANTSNYTTFTGVQYVHSLPIGVCSTCHNDTSARGKPATHVSTTAACDTCHTASNTGNYSTFLGASYIHPTPPGVCSTCHNGATAIGKHATHVVTTGACSFCHTQTNTSNYTTFLGASFVHATPPGVCSTCHDGNQATGKPVFHIPTALACDSGGCHSQSNTSNYTTFTGVEYAHTLPIGVCSTCHNGTSARGKSATHVATTATCDTCHTASNTGNYSTFLGASYTHATPPGICSTCHNGATAPGKPAAHVSTTAACSLCHTQTNTSNYTTFLGAAFVHASPPGTCATCHDGNQATGKPVFHIPTSAACDSSGCHSQTNTLNYSTFTGVEYSHPTPIGVCSTCHNGTSARGKSATHVSTTAACDTCHTASNTGNYSTFLGATYVHPTPPGVCTTCHNGVTAIGKSATHVVTNAACSLCHTQSNTANYTTFVGATYAHATPPGVCTTCHNGSTALGKHAAHIATTLPCDSCHTAANTNNYTTFTGATGGVDHTVLVPPAAGSCQRSGCHNGVGARGLSAGHIPLPAAAASCDSGGCHRYTGSVPSFAGAVMNNTPAHAAVASARCESCHNGAYTTQGTLGAYGKVGNHIPTTITTGLDCNTCHTTTSYTSLSNWLTERMNHNGAQGGGVGGNGTYCVTCHLSGTSYMGTMDKKSHEGTSMTKDCSKSGCHKPLGSRGSTYVNWD